MNDWKQSKFKVNKLPSDYIKVFNEYNQNEPDKVKINQSGKYKRCQVNLPRINDFELWLLVYFSKEGGVKKASYILFNDEKNMIYERDLINEHTKTNNSSREDWVAEYYNKK